MYMYTYTYMYMNHTIYIRNEDEKAWAEIKDIPEFIHSSICNLGSLGDATPEIQKVSDDDYSKFMEEEKEQTKPEKWSGPLYKKNGKL